jgi:hypothetical protein
MLGWISKLQRSSVFVLGALIGGAAVTLLGVSDKVLNITDRLKLTTSEALVAAQETAKSNFSDHLMRNAFQRIFLAQIYAQRVADKAGQSDVDEAWRSYIQSLIEWNADLMIYIVGLKIHYGEAKSLEFEDRIQNDFRALDAAVRCLHLALLNPTRVPDKSDGPPPELVGTDRCSDNTPAMLTSSVLRQVDLVRGSMYIFVTCLQPPDPNSIVRKEGVCGISKIIPRINFP